MTKKVLYIINHMDWFWSHRLPLANKAKEEGWQVLVCAPRADKDTKLAEYGFKGFSLNKIYGPVCVWYAIKKIRRILEEEKPNLIHAITIKFALPAGLAARGQDVNVIHTLAGLGYLFAGDGLKPKLLRMLVGPFLKKSFISSRTKLIFQNPDDMELMIKQGYAEREASYLIKGSGVDLEQFSAVPEPESEKPLVLFPTRLVWEKGIKVFIEAANILDQKGLSARYAIAGGISKTNPSAVTEAEMKKELEGSSVEWLGHVDNMPKLLQESAIIAYPSWYGEGVPKVLLEAAASARPIITTDHAGCRETVIEGKNGYLVSVRNAEALAERIEELVLNPQLRKIMGQTSRELAKKEFDVKSVVKRTVDLYDF